MHLRGFGTESFSRSVERLARNGIRNIELPGYHYGSDLGYRPAETLKILSDNGVTPVGVCGMFSAENELAAVSGIVRQHAIDYIKRSLDFAAAVGAQYMLVLPGAVGRPKPLDDNEFGRAVSTLLLVADHFTRLGIRAAIEPIRSAEVSLCHTVADAKRFIAAVDHPAVQHINGDVFHMQAEESHIGDAILEAGAQLTNLHLADSNRSALGCGSMDVDTIIRALYLVGYNRPGCFATPEPLGPGGDPYPAMYGSPDPEMLDKLVAQTATYWREREHAVRA